MGRGGISGGRSSNAEPGTIPILVPGRKTNYALFIKAVKKEAAFQFGNLSRLYDTGEYYVPPAIDFGDVELDAPVQTGTLRQTIENNVVIQESKNRTNEIAKMNTDRPKLYALVERRLSKASEEVLKLVPNWSTIESTRCPLLQHVALRASHVVDASGNADQDKQSARTNFYVLRQAGTNVHDFFETFQYAVDALVSTKQEAMYSTETLVTEFIEKLDDRYAQFKVDIKNKLITVPTTLAEALQRASRYKVVASGASGGYSDNTTMIISAGDFSLGSSGRGRSDRGRGDRGRGRGRGGHYGRGSSSSSGSKDETDSNKRKREDNSDTSATAKQCWNCKKVGHFARDCQQAKQVTGIALTDADADEQETDSGWNLMSAMSVVEKVIAAGFLNKLDEYDVFLDSGANISLWKDMSILDNVHDSTPMSTRGISGNFTVTQRGMLPGFFEISGGPQAIGNILSLSQVEDHVSRIDYVKGEYYRVWVSETYFIEFRRRYGVYIGNMREYLE